MKNPGFSSKTYENPGFSHCFLALGCPWLGSEAQASPVESFSGPGELYAMEVDTAAAMERFQQTVTRLVFIGFVVVFVGFLMFFVGILMFFVGILMFFVGILMFFVGFLLVF